jgi:WD40 repeat protein
LSPAIAVVDLDPRRFTFDWKDHFFEPFEAALQGLPNHRHPFAARNLSPSFALLMFGIRATKVPDTTDARSRCSAKSGSPRAMMMRMRVLAALALVAAWAWCSDAKLYLELGHSLGINAAAFSPDGRFILTGGYENSARLWEAATGRELRRFEGHSSSINSVAFSPDGRRVLTGSTDQTARLWDAATGAELRRFDGHSGAINSVAFSPNGRFVLTGSHDRTARLWDAATGKHLRSFAGHSAEVNAAAFSPDGRLVLTGAGDPFSSDFSARLWETETGAEVSRFEGHSSRVVSVSFSPDGRTVLTGDGDENVRSWDIASGKVSRKFNASLQGLSAVAFSPDGRRVVAACLRSPAVLWDAVTGTKVREFEGGSAGTHSVAFSPDGRFVLTANAYGTARLWDATTGKEVRSFMGRAAGVGAVAFSPDGRLVLTGSDTAQLWDLAAGKEVRRFEGHTVGVNSASFSRDGRLVLTGGEDTTAQLWEVATGSELRRFEVPARLWAAALSPDGRFALTGSSDKLARLWDTATGKELRRFEGHSGKVTSVAFSPDGRLALTGSEDNTARLWDATTGKMQQMSTANSFQVSSVAFSPDGRSAFSGSFVGSLWGAATGKEVQRLPRRGGAFVSAAFSPLGHTLLTGGGEGVARLWDVQTGSEVRTFEGHSRQVASVAFSPDGRFALTGSYDGTTRMWNVETGKEIATLVAFRGGGWAVVAPDGRFDTDSFDGMPLHWMVDTDPMRALPLEILMRDYFTPRLLPRMMAGEKLPPLPGIGEIKNRVQPEVRVAGVRAQPNGRAAVTVRAASVTERGQASGLRDLRVFRDGQLVGWKDGPMETGEFTFRDIQLRASSKEAIFTAYAFNDARIKSVTSKPVSFRYAVTMKFRPRAYLVQIGINHYRANGCELQFAVNDADKLSEALRTRLAVRGLDVVPTELTSPARAAGADKLSIREALAKVARSARPDDSLFLSFAGHGYTERGGQFFIFPSDVEGSCEHPDSRITARAISANELAEWLRPVDAGEITFILDSCYSAKSVEANDFKPGPMGNQGLGQLAYDKRMRILAASQADQTAQEFASLGNGLLTYTLAEIGLGKGEADWRPVDGRITAGEWLAFAADQAPKRLEAGIAAREAAEKSRGVRPNGVAMRAAQMPALFDFTKKDEFAIVVR